jgi:uncharacterized protein YlxP (DUF503 family)
MIVGRMTVTLNIPGARSLKDKRRVIKSLIARIQNRHNAAVAEVGDNDKWQACRLGVAVVSNQGGHADRQLAAIMSMIDREQNILVVDYETELI